MIYFQYSLYNHAHKLVIEWLLQYKIPNLEMLTYNSYKRVYLKYIIMFKNVIEQIIELEQVRYTVHGIMHSAYLSYLYIYISLITLMVLIYHVAHHLDQNEISSEGGQDTSAWQISAHSSLAFSRKCLEIANFTCFTKSKCC